MNAPVRVAIVTGGGSGIGRATSLALAGAGWKVVLAGRRQAALDAVTAGRPGMLGVATDVTDEESVRRLFDRAVASFGRIDLLFNNAGVDIPSTPVTGVTLADWSAVLAVNTTGAFLCAREAFRRMADQQPRGGRIINNGSVSAQVPRLNKVPYTVSKHAMTGLTRALILEGRALDIAVGQIDIGNAVTELTRSFAEPTMDVEQAAAAVLHMASLPPEANVPFMTVMATQMPLHGRG